MNAVLTIICQMCRRAKAEWNVDAGPGLLIALCDPCKRKNDKVSVSEITCRHGVSIVRECRACSQSDRGENSGDEKQ